MGRRQRARPPATGRTLSGWGDESIRIDIAHCTLGVNGLSRSQQAILEKRYAAFLASGATVQSEFHVLPERTAARGHERFVGPAGEYTLEMVPCADGVEITGYNFRADLKLAPDFRGRLWACDEMELTRNTVMENYLRIVTAYAALFQGGLLLHSAGFVLKGKAHLFLGRSGAGKTTLTRLARDAGAVILSDDINVIIPDQGGYAALPVPFAGELGAASEAVTDSVPLAGVHFIEKGTPTGMKSISSGECFAGLLVCTPFVNEDPFRLDQALDTISDLSQSCAGGVLRFGPEDMFDPIDDLLQEYVSP